MKCTLDFVNCVLKEPLACSLGSMAQGNLAGTQVELVRKHAQISLYSSFCLFVQLLACLDSVAKGSRVSTPAELSRNLSPKLSVQLILFLSIAHSLTINSAQKSLGHPPKRAGDRGP